MFTCLLTYEHEKPGHFRFSKSCTLPSTYRCCRNKISKMGTLQDKEKTHFTFYLGQWNQTFFQVLKNKTCIAQKLKDFQNRWKVHFIATVENILHVVLCSVLRIEGFAIMKRIFEAVSVECMQLNTGLN